MARPTKYTQSLHERFVTRLRQYGFLEHACSYVGISEGTAYSWLERGANGDERYASFYEDVRKVRAELEGALVDRIQSDDEREDWKAAAWRLERLFPKRYGLAAKEQRQLQEGMQQMLELVRGDMTEDAYGQLISALARHAGFAGVVTASVADDEGADGTPQLPRDAG